MSEILNELQSVKKSLTNLSVVIIYSREESKLLLEAVKSIPEGCEIITCLTRGSVSPQTREIERGNRINLVWEYYQNPNSEKYDYTQNEFDFSKARNFAKSYATRDWILSLDADERLCMDTTELEMLGNVPENIGGFYVGVHNQYWLENKFQIAPRYAVPLVRLFRKNIDWRNRCHERIIEDLTEKGYKICESSIVIKHIGYNVAPDKMLNKDFRNLAMMATELKRNPEYSYLLNRTFMILRNMSVNGTIEFNEKIECEGLQEKVKWLTENGVSVNYQASKLAKSFVKNCEILEQCPTNLIAIKSQLKNMYIMLELGMFQDSRY